MTLKDIKTLQEMGFSLDDIKKEFFETPDKSTGTQPIQEPASDQRSEEPDTGNVSDPGAAPAEGPSKKNESGSGDSGIESLKEELQSIKNMMFNKYASEDKEKDKAKTPTMVDVFNSIIN